MGDHPSSAPFSHCSSCGHRFPDRAGWPRRCAVCEHVTYRNPLPVVVLAVPVEDMGVLMVRRVDPPAGLALPSGYIEYGERWQDAAARELAEETGIRVDAAAISELRVRSGEDGTLLVFATAPPVARAELAAFSPSAEVSELVVVGGPRDDVVFPLDAEVIAALRRSHDRDPTPARRWPYDHSPCARSSPAGPASSARIS
jgi:ADP-ribose pyrophosphatase YjhB (NUDIX family)